MKKLLENEKAFLLMNEGEALKVALKTKEAALTNKTEDEVGFTNAIFDASNGAFTMSRCNNGKQVSFAKCGLFKLTHAKKHPGRIAYENIDKAIMNSYVVGREIIYKEKNNMVFTYPTEQSSAIFQKRNACEVIKFIITSVIVFYYADADIRDYLHDKGCNLDNDIKVFTNDVISCTITKDTITYRNKVGRTLTINAVEKSKEELKSEMHKVLMMLLVSAAISSLCREQLSQAVNIDSIEELSYASSANPDSITMINGLSPDNLEPTKQDNITTNTEINPTHISSVNQKPEKECRETCESMCQEATNKKIKVFTAFSGYDSQCMALERIREEYPKFDYELVGWSEIDSKAIVSHNVVFPEYANCFHGDICKIDWSSVPDFDLFTYSSPCQSFSSSGKREGGEEGSGTTSALLWECRRAIETKRPKYCIFENVKGLVDKTMYHTFEDWQLTMCSLGYENKWQVMNAADYGVPQHRERVIMVSIRIDDDGSIPEFVFPESVACDIRPEKLLEYNVNDKYYRSAEECDAYLDLLENAAPGYEVNTDFRGCHKTRPTISGDCIKRFVTPLCQDGTLPTVMASSTGSVSSMFSLGEYPCPGIVEIRYN